MLLILILLRNASYTDILEHASHTDMDLLFILDESSCFVDLQQSPHHAVPQSITNVQQQTRLPGPQDRSFLQTSSLEPLQEMQPEQSLLHSSLSSLEHANVPLNQTFSKNIFDDLPIDFDLSNNYNKSSSMLQPTNQPRFSFLPPSILDEKLRPTKCEVNNTDLSSLFPLPNEQLRQCVADSDVPSSYSNGFGNNMLSRLQQQNDQQQDIGCCKNYQQDFSNWGIQENRLPALAPMLSLINTVNSNNNNNNNMGTSFNMGSSAPNSILWENSYYL